VAALALLAGWMLVDVRLRDAGVGAHTVVQTSDVRFLAPAEASLEATAVPPEEEAWRRFTKTLSKRGRARVRLTVEVRSGGVHVATLAGAYVALTGEA
jgi:thioesterase domain-containing protein